MLPFPLDSNREHVRPSSPSAPSAGRGVAPTRRIVAIGGGTGLPAVLEGLCAHSGDVPHRDPDAVTAIVTMTDDGGSSGRLREVFGVLPPGDVRNCIAATAHMDSPLRDLLQHRFSHGSFEGHPVGNLLLTALTQMTGSFAAAVDKLGEMAGARARILPSTREDVRLIAEMESGRVVSGETAITGAGERIRKISIAPRSQPLPDVLRALINAHGVVVGPGSLYTSILPVLLVEGVASTISAVDAVRIYVANLMTEPGETDDYTLDDHLHAIRTHAGFDLFDYILVNTASVDPGVVAQYEARGARSCAREPSLRWAGRAQVIECALATEYNGRKIRHAPASLARAIRTLVERGRPKPRRAQRG